MRLILSLWIAIEWTLVLCLIALVVAGGPIVWFLFGWLAVFILFNIALKKID